MNLLLGNLFRRRSKKNRRSLGKRKLRLESLESRCLLTAVTLTPVKDNSIYSDSPNNSNARGLLYVGLNNDGNNVRRALLDFDVAGAVPAGATINSASLSMYSVRNNNGGALNAELHKLTADWGEGTSLAGSLTRSGGGGTAATTNDATWNRSFYNTVSWASAGGDFSPTISSSTTVSGPDGTGSFTWVSTPQMVADVQSWLNNPNTAYGWLVKGSAATEAVNSAHAFAPREATTVAQRPTLTIDYTLAAANLPPTLNALADPAAINQNAGLQTVNLAGIGAGAGETQALRVTAASDNTALIPNPTVSYTSPNATGSVSYQPVANQSGTAHVTVTVRDAGLDGVLGNTDDATFARTFTVLVNAVNQTPTLNALADPAAINQNAGLQMVNLAGIGAGAGETQALRVTVASDNTALIPNPTVSYTSPNATGSVSYQPVANQSGTAHVTVTVRDAGLDGVLGNTDDATFARTFTVLVNAVNQTPTLNALADPAAINQNAGLQTVNLAGITAGAGETQALRVTAASDNTALIPNPTVSYTSPNATGSVSYQPVANQSGTAHVTVTVRDAGLDGVLGNTDDATFARTFTVLVNPPQVNQTPTLNAIADPAAINQNAGLQTVNLAGISAGTGETQALRVTAASDNTALIPNPTVSYTSPNATGSVSYQPVANQSGTAHVTVTVRDAGLDGVLGNTDDATFARTFTVLVNPPQVNQTPTLNVIADPAAINQNAGLQTVNLAGIGAGTGETQALRVTAASDNTALIPNPTVSYTSPNATGSVSYQPVANQSGTAHVTVTVRDAGLDGVLGNTDDATFARTFTVLVNPPQVNQTPTLNALADPAAINQNAGLQTVNLAGIGAGTGETQALRVTAASDNTALIPNPTVSYTSPNATGSVSYQPVANQSGTAHVTVTVRDAGLDGVLGNTDDATFARTFTVVVNPPQVNQTPTLNVIPDPAAINQNAGLQTVNLAGIGAGTGETQVLQVTAASDNTALIPNPTVSYTSPNATGSVSYQPVANQSGTAHVTVTVRDAGLDGVLGNTDDATFARTFTVLVSQGTVVTLASVKDNTLIRDTTKTLGSTSNGTGAIYAGQNADGSVTLRGLVSFDVAGSIPAGATIQSVALKMYVTKTQAGATDVGLYDVQQAWGEAGSFGSGAVGGPAAIGDATWLHTAYDTQPWTVPGGDFAPTASAVQTVGPAGAAYTWNSTPQMVADVQAWLDQPGTNFGWLLKADETSPSAKEFASHESSNAAQRPALIIGYALNQSPTLDAIPDPAAINQNAGLQTVSLAGVTAGAGETQALRVTAASDNTALIPNPTVSYTSPSAAGSLSYQPVANQSGTAHVTVTVRDAGLDGVLGNTDDATFARTFTVVVGSQSLANQPPTLNPLPDPAPIGRRAGWQTVNLTGITAGTGESQTLRVSATSDNRALIPNPTVSYRSPNATGTLSYRPVGGRSGTANITVTVRDAGVDRIQGNADDATSARTFTVVVLNGPVTADVGVALNVSGRVETGATLTFTIQVTNAGPQAAPGTLVTDVFPSGLSQVTWTAVAAGGATGALSGQGNLRQTINVPAHGSMTYTVTGVVTAREGRALSDTVTVSTADGIRDPQGGNNRQTRLIAVVDNDAEDEGREDEGREDEGREDEGREDEDREGEDREGEDREGKGEAAPVGVGRVAPAQTAIADAFARLLAGSSNPAAHDAVLATPLGLTGQSARSAVSLSAPDGVRLTATAKAASPQAWQDASGLEDPFDHLGVEAVLSNIAPDIATAWPSRRR